MDSKTLWKPAAAFYRARLYFVVGLIILAVGQVLPIPFSDVEEKRLLWWQLLTNKALGTLDKAGYLIILAGFVYAVLSDVGEYIWSGKLISEIKEGFSDVSKTLSVGVSDINFERVLSWVTSKRPRPEHLKAVATASLKEYYGEHTIQAENYVDFVIDDLLDKAAGSSGVTRENLRSHVVLRGIDHDTLVQWEEDKSYTLVCPGGSGEHRLQAVISCRAYREQLTEILSQLALVLTVDGEVHFDFSKWLSAQKLDISSQTEIKLSGGLEGGGVLADGERLELTYDGSWLKFAYVKRIKLSKARTVIHQWEQSLLPKDDRAYTVLMDQPTFRFSFSMSLERMEGWQVKEPQPSALAYQGEARKFVTVNQMTTQRVSTSVERWVLPGLALYVEWTPPTPSIYETERS